MSELPLDALVEEAAEAICGALLRCCDEGAAEGFFSSLLYNERYAALAPRTPPNAPLDAATCPALVRDFYAIGPLGPWAEAARRGEVGYSGEEAAACLAALKGAACGDEVRGALTDGECLGLVPPLGGESQRRMFSRSRAPGEPCRPITDGVGATFYGTCDPARAFCCYRDARGGCLPGSDFEVEGECVAVSAVGEACNLFPAQLCATGVECSDDGVCVTPSAETLPLGAVCVESFSLLGECEGGFCDLTGSERCEPLRADGEMCGAGYECLAGGCVEGVCGVEVWCGGGR